MSMMTGNSGPNGLADGLKALRAKWGWIVALGVLFMLGGVIALSCVATATACALFGLECTVYMGEEDIRRQKLNVFNMRTMGAKVVPVTTGSRTLRDATNEAMRDWMGSSSETHYTIGSVVGPHPFPMIVRDFQSVIGKEARRQILEKTGKLPDCVVACVGGGSRTSKWNSWARKPAGGALRRGNTRRASRKASRASCTAA